MDFTLYEIYLDYRTGSLGLSATSALFMTGLWTKICLNVAFAAGYETGNGMLWLGNQINPGFSDWLAGELGAGLEDAINLQLIMMPDVPFLDPGCGCSVTVEWDQVEYKD